MYLYVLSWTWLPFFLSPFYRLGLQQPLQTSSIPVRREIHGTEKEKNNFCDYKSEILYIYLLNHFCHPVGHLPVSLVKSLLDYFFTHSTNLTPLKPERLLRMQQNEELNLICRKAKSNVAIRGSITSETIFESFMNRFAHLWIISVAFGPIYTL